MSKFPRYDPEPNGHGLCCIIANFYSVSPVIGQNNILPGYEHDVERITTFFKEILKYKIHTEFNLTKAEFFTALDTIKKEITKDDNIDRLVVFILSHGSEEGILTCSGGSGMAYEKDANGKPMTVKVETITKSFDHWNIPSLKGYPKCIFIQACRGVDVVNVAPHTDSRQYTEYIKNPNYDDFLPTNIELSENAGEVSTDVCKEEKQDEEYNEDNDVTINFPLEEKQIPNPSSANMLIAFACLPNTVSFVNNTRGSWFITTLMKKIEDHYKDEHIMDILSDVNNEIIDIKAQFNFPINYITDNTMAAFIKVSDKFKPFSVFAYYNDHFLGKVHYISHGLGQATEYKGVLIRNAPMPIERHSHIIRCLVKCVKLGSVQTRDMTPTTYEKDILRSNDHTVIANSCQLINRNNGRTVGIGKVYHDDPSTLKLTKIEHSILYHDDKEMTYYGSIEFKDRNGVVQIEKIDNIDGMEALVSKKSMVEGPNKCRDVQIQGKVIQQHSGSHPVIEGHVQQLCVFESTLTKKFYLSNEKVGKDVVDSKSSRNVCAGSTLTADGNLANVDAPEEERSSFVGFLWDVYTSSME